MQRVGAMLSDEAANGWISWSAHHGFTVSAALEAIGLTLSEGERWRRPIEESSPELQATVRRARKISAARRRR